MLKVILAGDKCRKFSNFAICFSVFVQNAIAMAENVKIRKFYAQGWTKLAQFSSFTYYKNVFKFSDSKILFLISNRMWQWNDTYRYIWFYYTTH